MTKKKLRIWSFAFEKPAVSTHHCDFCGADYELHGIAIVFAGTLGRISLEGTWICGDCVLSGPRTVSKRMERFALSLRNDPTTQRRVTKEKRREKRVEEAVGWAKDLEEWAPHWRQLRNFSSIHNYEMARVIATVQAAPRREKAA